MVLEVAGTGGESSSVGGAFGQKAIRGVIINPIVPLSLAFHFNPHTVNQDKQNNYNIETPTGFNAPIVTWVSGGVKRLKFDLHFENTPGGVDSRQVTFNTPLIGARGAISVLQSFMEPEKDLLDFIGGGELQKPPPECFLILGLRFWRTRLVSAPIDELLFDLLLTPERILASLEFIVLEEGIINEVNQVSRKALAIIESTVGFVSTFLTIF